MNTREEFIKLYTIFCEANKAEYDLDKFGIYLGESIFANSIYGLFDIAINFILNKKGREVLYEEILFKDIEMDIALSMLEGYFL